MSLLKIRPHKIQRQALAALESARKISSHAKALTVLPSGMGKTHLTAFDANKVGAKRILFIAHRLEIIEQAESIFASVYGINKGRWNTGIVSYKKKDYDCQMIFATVQTLSRPKVLEEIAKIQFDYVALDEYHHSAAKTYQRVLNALQTKLLHGFTATPFRQDNKDILGSVNNNLVYSMDLEAGIKSKQLVPFYYHGLYDNVDYSDIKWNGYKYKEKDLNKKLIIDKRDNQIIEEYKNSIHPTRRLTLMFCVSVKHAHRMAAKLESNGIVAKSLTYETPIPIRHQITSDFRTGKIDVLCVRDIFNEGVDFPECSAIMLLRPTMSRTVFYQQLGRGLRKAEGKKNVLIYDFVSNYKNAYRIKEWLGFAKQTTSKYVSIQKPEYHYNVPTVYFDKTVIEIFKVQNRIPIAVSWIEDAYIRLAKKLSSVHISQKQWVSEYGKESFFALYSRFGGLGHLHKAVQHKLHDIPDSACLWCTKSFFKNASRHNFCSRRCEQHYANNRIAQKLLNRPRFRCTECGSLFSLRDLRMQGLKHPNLKAPVCSIKCTSLKNNRLRRKGKKRNV